MTKKTFCEVVKELVSLKRSEDAAREAFRKFEPEMVFPYFIRHEALVVKCLEEAMNDTYQWVSYWLYDLDCGRVKNLKVKRRGKIISMKTPANLYDCIVSEF